VDNDDIDSNKDISNDDVDTFLCSNDNKDTFLCFNDNKDISNEDYIEGWLNINANESSDDESSNDNKDISNEDNEFMLAIYNHNVKKDDVIDTWITFEEMDAKDGNVSSDDGRSLEDGNVSSDEADGYEYNNPLLSLPRILLQEIVQKWIDRIGFVGLDNAINNKLLRTEFLKKIQGCAIQIIDYGDDPFSYTTDEELSKYEAFNCNAFYYLIIRNTFLNTVSIKCWQTYLTKYF
jgi:hypothetical protein